MKKTIIGAALVLFCGMALFAQNYRDGFYFAQDADYANNQKNQVVLAVRGGKITSANWNLLSLTVNSKDIKSIAADGRVAAAMNWASQAARVEAHLVSTQDVNTASVAGGPANVKPFFDLVKKALAGQLVAKGSYAKDGWYFATASAEDEYHTKNTALITVVNGTIVDALWNGDIETYYKDINRSKYIASMNKKYPMKGAAADWHVQAKTVAAALVAAQNPDTIKTKANGTPDGISGASIQIKDFLATAKTALQSAK
jgi:major membrane immunogen (membrane-anchored lipoprotein)